MFWTVQYLKLGSVHDGTMSILDYAVHKAVHDRPMCILDYAAHEAVVHDGPRGI